MSETGMVNFFKDMDIDTEGNVIGFSANLKILKFADIFQKSI